MVHTMEIRLLCGNVRTKMVHTMERKNNMCQRTLQVFLNALYVLAAIIESV